jgi:hypothetical protein
MSLEALTQSDLPRNAADLDSVRLADSLSKRLVSMTRAYKACQSTLSQLGRYIKTDCELIDADDALQSCFDRWLNDLLEGLSQAHQGITQAEIEYNSLDELDLTKLRDTCPKLFRFLRDDGDIETAADRFIKEYKFNKLVVALQRFSSELESNGLRDAADILVNGFNLNARFRDAYAPRKAAKHAVFITSLYTSYGSYDYRTVESFFRKAKALKIMEADTGVTGLSSSMTAIFEAFSNNSNRPFDSRTVLAKGTKLEAVIFNTKIEFRMDPEAADALLAFVTMHSKEQVRGLTAAA